LLQYALPIFLGAFLLFQVQPIIARCILPWFGGTPAVWTTCMLFFQVLLLGGYAYAHWVATRLRPRAQAVTHGALLGLSLAVLAVQLQRWGVPIIPGQAWKPATPDAPVAHILLLLGVTVGLPYFVVATTSPLLQAWFCRQRPGVSPYRLYTLSNAGSLLALLSYPVLVEPSLAMRSQAAVWAAAYVVFVGAYLVCVLRSLRAAGAGDVSDPDSSQSAAAAEGAPLRDEDGSPSWQDRLSWFLFPAVASTLLLAVTNQICQELAVIPFLWILPLTIYLLSFIICFDNPKWYERSVYLPATLFMLPLVGYVMGQPLDLSVRRQIVVYAAALFVGCMFCHGEVVARRPHPRHLTAFYLAISVGGAVGGIFVGLVAPLIFSGFYELHVALTGLWLIGLATVWRWRLIPDWLRGSITVALIALSIAVPVIVRVQAKHDQRTAVLMACRNFYGVFRVEDRDRDKPRYEVHTLVHGATLHGLQYVHHELRRQPLSYYSPRSGLALAIANHPRRLAGLPLRIGVLGLGTGNVAIHGRAGDVVRFYEINPAVAQMARDTRYFSYIADSLAEVQVVLGDARLVLEREFRDQGSQQFDLLAMDAFSSDSVPAHLLTREAFEVYFRHLREPDGVCAVHVSNRFLDLKRVVYAASDYFGRSAIRIQDPGGFGTYKSDWMLMTDSAGLLSNPKLISAATPRGAAQPLRLWTDDYYNLFQILR
jgi:hypothetical protein